MIRKCFWLLLFVSAFLTLIFAGAYAAEDDEMENLVQNPGFEDEIVTPWTMWVEDGAAVADMSVVKDEVLAGKRSLLVDISQKGGGQRVELHQRHFTLWKEQELTFAFWAKTEKGEVRPARMIVNHRQDPWTSYGSKAITITDEWTEFWTPVVMPADDEIVGIYVELRDTVGLVWFDNFRLYEGDYVPVDPEGKPVKAVEPHSKLTSTWAAIKAVR